MALGNLAALLQTMSFDELRQAQTMIAGMTNVKEVKETFGDRFCSIMGVERIVRLVQVPATQLGLESDTCNYITTRVLPLMLGEHSAVRCVTGAGRPLIALKLAILNRETQQAMEVRVGLIYKRYSGQFTWHERETLYVAALCGQEGDKGHEVFNALEYTQEPLVVDLLEGKTVDGLFSNYLIRLA